MKTKLISAIFLALISLQIFAQNMNVLEKDYEMSRKAKNGYLGGVEAKENGSFDMIYFLPSSKRKVKIETYSFDKDANLTNTVKDEWEIEKARKRYKGLTYKGDVLINKSISVSSNMMGKLVYKNRLVTAKYNWLAGDYVKRVKMLAKQKLQNENGEEYYFGGAYEVERDSAILVMGYPLQKEKADFSKLDLMKVNNDGTIKQLATVNTGSWLRPIFSKPLLDDDSKNIDNDDLPRDWILVLSPAKNSGGNLNEMTYLRITPEGIIKENYKFIAPMAGYRIINAYEKNGAVMLYGLGIKKEGRSSEDLLGMAVSPSSMDSEEVEQTKTAPSTTEKVLGKLGGFGGMLGSARKAVNVVSGKEEMMPSQDALDTAMDEKKYTDFILCKVADGKVIFANATSLEDLNRKAVAGPDMKKPLSFDGKKFKTNNFQILNDGSMVLSFQDFKKNSGSNGGGKFLNSLAGVRSSGGSGYERVYQGLYMLHFSPEGQLKTNYTVLLDQKSKQGFFNTSPMTADNFSATSYIIESKDGKSINWIMEMVKAIDADTSMSTFNNYFNGTSTTSISTSYAPFYSIEFGKLDLANGKSSEFRTLGDLEKKKYYLYNKYNRLTMGDYTYFFSETPRGDRLLISRMNMNE